MGHQNMIKNILTILLKTGNQMEKDTHAIFVGT